MSRKILILGFIGCMAFFSCHKKASVPIPPVPVNLYTVAEQTVVYFDSYPGNTEGLNQVNLMPEVQGYITGIFFKDGSKVKKGQILYEIDKQLYQAAYNSQLANLKVAQDNLKEAQQDADRYTYLNNYKAVAKQQYDHAVIALQVAKSQVQAVQETLKASKTNLNYAVITAPYSGTIGFSQVKLGNMVSVGQTVLNTISTNDPMAVVFLLNEKQLPGFERILKSKALPDSLFTLLLPDNSLYAHQGEVSAIDRAVDPQTGSITVRLVFPNPDNQLKAGMSCVVRIHNQDARPQMMIPSRAVTEQMGEYFVFIAKKDTIHVENKAPSKSEPEKSGLIAVQKKITQGQTIGSNVVVSAGIAAGDRIIVDGIQNLHDGTPISAGKNYKQHTN